MTGTEATRIIRTSGLSQAEFGRRADASYPGGGRVMGHKVNPIGLRLGINRTWDSRWYAGSDYARLLHDDLKLRNHLRKRSSC